MLLPDEDIERWRVEEEEDRKLFVSPRLPALTHNHDEVGWFCTGRSGVVSSSGNRLITGCEPSLNL